MKIQLSKYLSYAPRKRFWKTPIVITAILATPSLWIVWPDWKPLLLSLALLFIALLFINGFQYDSKRKKEDTWKELIAQSNRQFADTLKRNREGISKKISKHH